MASHPPEISHDKSAKNKTLKDSQGWTDFAAMYNGFVVLQALKTNDRILNSIKNGPLCKILRFFKMF